MNSYQPTYNMKPKAASTSSSSSSGRFWVIWAYAPKQAKEGVRLQVPCIFCLVLPKLKESVYSSRCVSHAHRRWYSESTNFTPGLTGSFIFFSCCSRCQINCNCSACKPLHSAWLGCACRLIHVSQGGLLKAHWRRPKQVTHTHILLQPSPLWSKWVWYMSPDWTVITTRMYSMCAF